MMCRTRNQFSGQSRRRKPRERFFTGWPSGGGRLGALSIGIVFLAAVGCNDPYSQRRIQMRTAHLNETISDIERSEQRRARRLQESEAALQKWWRTDCERFERRAPTIGDYIW